MSKLCEASVGNVMLWLCIILFTGALELREGGITSLALLSLVLGTKTRAFCVQVKCSATQLPSQGEGLSPRAESGSVGVGVGAAEKPGQLRRRWNLTLDQNSGW